MIVQVIWYGPGRALGGPVAMIVMLFLLSLSPDVVAERVLGKSGLGPGKAMDIFTDSEVSVCEIGNGGTGVVVSKASVRFTSIAIGLSFTRSIIGQSGDLKLGSNAA